MNRTLTLDSAGRCDYVFGGPYLTAGDYTLEFFLNGSMAKVLTLGAVVIFLMIRPQGLFAVKVRR